MKLRIRGDSIRLRLSKSEVSLLADGGVVEDSASFGRGALLTYAIASGAALAAELSGARIEVSVPEARRWAESDEVSLEGTQPGDEGRELRILVEKDFPCGTVRPHEDDSDAFSKPVE